MINIQAVFVANGIAVVLLFNLLFNTQRKKHFSLIGDKAYYAMVILNLLQCFMEPAAFILDGKTFPGARPLLLIINCLIFANNIIFSFTWTVYADLKLFSDVGRVRRKYKFVLIPAFITVALIMVNLFTPVFFRISDTNEYERTALFIIPYIITYSYLMYGMAVIYKYKNRVNKYLFLPAVFFLIPVFLGSILQFFFYGLSLVWAGAAVALCTLYINVQNEVSSTDTLSGLFNRQYINQYLEHLIKHTKPQKMVAGIMLDIDRFKSINDTYGHLAGDDAIANIGRILRESAVEDSVAARFAGDEFVIILTVSDEAEVVQMISRIKSAIADFNALGKARYKMDVSSGYTVFDGQSDSVSEFFDKMDKQMYIEKNRKHAENEHND